MSQTKAISKILNIRENEKQLAQLAHHRSVEFFEQIATKLYGLLKKKEDAEVFYEISIKESTSIDKIKEHAIYIEMLNKQILRMQLQVHQARTKMDHKQLELTDAYVEVKKYEKIIELRKNEQREYALKQEQIMMDEISTQQFLKRKTGEYNGQTI